MDREWLGTRPTRPTAAVACPYGASVNVEDCYACRLGCDVGSANVGANRPVDADTLELLRAKLGMLLRPV
ncbi:MAG TPA: hypothetical protein VFC31_08860 [Candidatus Limnocylindria bacterium]|nr:hypothetical protein [Candidatus Limnocylindria bacterium]